MTHVPAGRMHQLARSPSEHPSPENPAVGAGDPFEKRSFLSPIDLESRYQVVKSVSSSPLRDDLELCLAELDALIAIADSASVVTYLHFKMEERRMLIIDALLFGSEL